MANPQDQGTFESFITDRITFHDAPPRSGDNGGFESWITDRIWWHEYDKATGAITKQIKFAQLGADLFDGALI